MVSPPAKSGTRNLFTIRNNGGLAKNGLLTYLAQDSRRKDIDNKQLPRRNNFKQNKIENKLFLLCRSYEYYFGQI